MKTNNLNIQEIQDSKIQLPMLLSKLWIFLSLNYILSDLLSNMEMSVLRGLLEGNIGGIPMTQGFLLLAGISLEIPFIMVVLSVVLPYKANRRINIGAATLMIIYQLASFFIGSDTTLHYIFFSAIEILGNFLILVLAVRWKK
ncbi:MAG: hypothetical protein GX787_01995 [Tissierellia bacterium]|jgi:hypothetical protein|nr:hypothetical protein [Tissierellia bacterium]